MKKTMAVKYILLTLGMVYMCWGCGKEAAEIALNQDDTSAVEQAAADEGAAVSGGQGEPSSAETPVIEVICNCQCGGAGDPQSGESVVQQPADDGKVNINTADAAELQTLNGIGASRAQAIILYRESYGLFQSIEEIKNVDGIKDGVYSKIKDEISVGR